MAVNSKITINRNAIKQLTDKAITALEQTGEALHTEIVQSEVMPRDEGTLQNEKTFVDYSQSRQGIVSLVSEGPYARRLYFHPEYNFQKFENAFAGGKWLEPWLKGGKNEDFCSKTFAKIYKAVSKL